MVFTDNQEKKEASKSNYQQHIRHIEDMSKGVHTHHFIARSSENSLSREVELANLNILTNKCDKSDQSEMSKSNAV